MTAASVSKWARGFVLASVSFLVVWQLAAVAGVPRRTEVVLGVYGFVLHMVFGKAYALLPAYFDRSLSPTWGPGVHLPATVTGCAGLALASLGVGPGWLGIAGATSWAVGVATFVGCLGWTIRDNPLGTETGTSEAKAFRRPVDRVANVFMPVALLYLLVGTYETLVAWSGLPSIIGGYPPGASHILAAGTAALLVFAVGFRLLPRFLVTRPSRPLVVLVLATGAVGPLLLAVGVPDRPILGVGAAVQAVAVTGFAVAFVAQFLASDRRRVGLYGALMGVSLGVVGVAIGLGHVMDLVRPALLHVHFRVNVLGFLGLTIVGVAYQFYPPAVAKDRLSSDRTALLSIGSIGLGLLGEAIGIQYSLDAVILAGRMIALLGALLYAWILTNVFRAR